MINTVKDYNNSYSYQRMHKRKQRRNFIILSRVLGSILPMLSIFSLFMLSDRCGNWTLAAVLIIISMALFMQTKGEY